MFRQAAHSKRQRPVGSLSMVQNSQGWQLLDQYGALFLQQPGDEDTTKQELYPLCVPTPQIATTIIAEWPDYQSTEGAEHALSKHRPERPMTQIIKLALLSSAAQRRARMSEIVSYLHSDTIGYWQQYPQHLHDAQQQQWGDLLEWCRAHWGEAPEPQYRLQPLVVPAGLEGRVRAYLDTLDDFAAAALAFLCPISGSLLISLAQCIGHINAEKAYRLANLEALYQQQQWGSNEETQQHMARLRQAFIIAEQCFRAYI